MENQDENIKKFNLRNYYNENKKIFVSFLILVIVSTILIIGVREYYSKVNKDISNEFNKAKILIQKNNSIEAAKILGKIIEKNNSFYSPSALNLIIENNLIKDKEQILSYFDEVISETDLDTDIRDLFIFRNSKETEKEKKRRIKKELKSLKRRSKTEIMTNNLNLIELNKYLSR